MPHVLVPYYNHQALKQNVFITNLDDAMDPLVIFLLYKILFINNLILSVIYQKY
jgi:hypothetical protein